MIYPVLTSLKLYFEGHDMVFDICTTYLCISVYYNLLWSFVVYSAQNLCKCNLNVISYQGYLLDLLLYPNKDKLECIADTHYKRLFA